MKHPDPIVLDLDGRDSAAQDAEIRARGPVVPVKIQGGVHAWVITGAAPLRSVLAGAHVSKDARLHWPAWRNGEIPDDHPLLIWHAPDNMFTTYGPTHKKLRGVAAKWFTHRNTQALRPRIKAISTDLLDDLAARPAGEMVDLRDAYAYPVPIRVISELLGVPEHLGEGLRACVDGLFDTSAAASSYEAMFALLAELVAYRTENPGDDLTSLLIAGKAETGVTERQIADTQLLMISAGHETTVNLFDQVIYHLNAAPHWREMVMSGKVAWPAVFDETLRLEAPVRYIPTRFAVEDFELCGVEIKAGEPILASYGLAGRDPEVHGPTADQFDPTRPTRSEHVSFGFGAHHCLGRPLALMEAEIAVPALFSRFPDLALTTTDSAELGSTHGYIANGHVHLPALLKG